MAFQTQNPYTSETLNHFNPLNLSDIKNHITKAHQRFLKSKLKNPKHREEKMRGLAELLKQNKTKLAKQITLEMGKPIAEAVAEIEKCAWVCEFYAKNASSLLTTKTIKTDAKQSYVLKEPIGVILAIMPWNYPFWQVFRVIAPNLMLGNSVLIKHAPNVLGCGEMIQKLVEDAGFESHSVTHLIVEVDQIKKIINHNLIKGVTLTGSTKAGSIVASQAGKAIKKSVLELGGNNALVVFEDADLDKAAEICVKARFQNTGQSCIAGKRLLVHNTIYDKFLEKIKIHIQNLNIGNPLDETIDISVLARKDIAENLKSQLDKSVEMGAKIILGGQQDNTFFEPTLVENVSVDMPIFNEETFSPLLAVTSFKTEEEAIQLINHSNYGLGVSLFTKDNSKYKRLIPQIEDGAVFVNSLVKSDPRLPFGGTKHSGYGRELGHEGILEFANIKTVYIQ
ncbi:NAD-dependent succinate-semialdehyde dehydrogenase [Flavobacterium sp. CS20]|uniref:NAD-dependent succinate-semialdehyde dehydrogenase n=1 Tax=Flavobacterium sp. CS20 TaxID=2775246 RepID=UPI001B39D119|nr:NAD-dependent succinate-semialdehyde dehydrogenase [Flavobacterium sp. CS20]QTY27398.1 NAD-dependent succinate-semialdehyde dehydrogenase [Flavobacterium sp. CS20]